MRQNGNKIWHIKNKRSLKLAAAMLAVSLAFPMAAQAKAWDFENGSYVDASGTPIEGAVAKGITVTKYQNRANRENGIDWGKVAADGIGFAMIRIGYYKDKDPYFDRNITEAAAHGIKQVFSSIHRRWMHRRQQTKQNMCSGLSRIFRYPIRLPMMWSPITCWNRA